MEKEYKVEGMTCMGCVSNVKNKLEKSNAIAKATIKLEAPQATIKFKEEMDLASLQNLLGQDEKYQIKETEHHHSEQRGIVEKKSFSTYKPLILIVAFIAGVCLLVQFPFGSFSIMLWMRHFMAGFFIVFAFFKLLNLESFANSYKMYDIIAKRWNFWGYLYPFMELTLGILYLLDLFPVSTNLSTALVLSLSSIGVIQSNLNKSKIKCACLGDIFNLPMSTVTIVEDVSMVIMAVIMLIVH